eukprot:CAMPEP_0113706718 /NCGR_PEP_ID=MMETSP0038_2-20120614/27905_1 /TAXON_ID=2898 /ORGANISM="Cryptomonas paramecium" /LENGTH=38 /DNA_ID=CAMNT_0000631991 /DNA_START=317 /DNA_END=430 /DNA_ORIENTATION=+ /assembly_acc=CAM_ASM_000170
MVGTIEVDEMKLTKVCTSNVGHAYAAKVPADRPSVICC